MTTLILVRHGETDWNRDGIWQGHGDPPLNDLGRRQAAELAERLADVEIDALYSSDLRRAYETAEIVGAAKGLEITAEPDLREMDVGSWSGLTREEIATRFPGMERHDGEAREAFDARAVGVLHRIAGAHEGQQVLVVTHGGVVRALERHLFGEPRDVLAQLRDGLVPLRGRSVRADRLTHPVDDYTSKYKGEQVEVALFGGDYQEGVLTAYCSIDDIAHVELNGHILIPLQNVASLHCSSRCDAPEPDWPPRGLGEEDTEEES